MSTPKINVSTEMMTNFRQAELMSPEKKFEALQTDTGYSLLFSIGTDNVFYVTQEIQGEGTGWAKTDLSSAQVAVSFPGQSCKTFEAAQSVVDGTIGIAMVITDGTNDHLFLCLGNSNSDMDWLNSPEWVQYPFDNPSGNVSIANVFISETSEDDQYIIVDTLRDPASAEKLISRYFIDLSQNLIGPAWKPQSLPIDLEADNYSSCLGRQEYVNSPHQPTVDGLYTCGQVDGNPQFIFQPLYDTGSKAKTPASPVRLQLPNGYIAEAMASCRKPNVSTDLYVCSNGGLYFFVSTNQSDSSTAVLLFANSMFNGVRKMYAYQYDGKTIVWGLNGNDEIFYTSCPTGNETDGLWSYPVPIVNKADMFTPYLNCVDNGNTFFSVAGDILQKSVKSSDATVWTTQRITLPSLDSDDTQQYSSYTTHIQVTDENNQPMPATTVKIVAAKSTAVYINYLYYIIDTNGIEIKTDSTGTITVVEWIDGLVGTALSVTPYNGAENKINPMDAPFNKLTALNTVDSLRAATITYADGTTKPLVSSSVSDDDLQTVADSNTQLAQAYASFLPGAATMSMKVSSKNVMSLAFDPLQTIVVDAGDLFSWLKTGVEAVINIVEDAAAKVWHFVATIAGEVFSCVLDCIEAVVSAIQWVFNVIETAIEDLISFLEFLFSWDDILTTHNVMKNTLTQFMQHGINSMLATETEIRDIFSKLIADVDAWANIPVINDTPNSTTASANTATPNAAPANLGVNHYQGNVTASDTSYTVGAVDESIFDALLELLKNEGQVVEDAMQQINDQIIQPFKTLTITEIIQRFIAIMADAVLESIEDILVAIIDVFVQLTEGLMSILTATIEIPVLSWLYQKLTGNDLSFLDLICLVSAIPATIVYKATTGKAPFNTEDAFTQNMLAANSFAEIQQAFYTYPSAKQSSGMMVLAKSTPVLNTEAMEIFGMVTSIFATAGTVVLIITTSIQKALEIAGEFFPKSPGKTDQILTTVCAVSNLAYISPNFPAMINVMSDNLYQQLNNALTAISAVKGFVNIPLTGTKNFMISKISPLCETIINGLWNYPVMFNLLGSFDSDEAADDVALLFATVGNLGFNFGGLLEFSISLTPVTTNAFLIQAGIQDVLMIIYGICMPVSATTYLIADN